MSHPAVMNYHCQLCGRRPLDEFVATPTASSQAIWWLCRRCELYQFGPPAPVAGYEGEFHRGYERRRAHKLWTAAARLNRIAPLVSARSPRLLDVGCSVGCTVQAAGRRGWEAIGVDVSRQAREYCQRHGLRCELTDGHTLPFGDQSFDVVTAWHVIEHVTDVDETLAEWRRVLRPGGILALETPNAACRRVRRLGPRYRHFWVPTHTYAFTPDNLSRFVQRAGFQILRRPRLGRLADLSLPQAGYAVLYHIHQELRRMVGVDKAFQTFACRHEVAAALARHAAA